jgi:hypothetical protein
VKASALAGRRPREIARAGAVALIDEAAAHTDEPILGASKFVEPVPGLRDLPFQQRDLFVSRQPGFLVIVATAAAAAAFCVSVSVVMAVAAAPAASLIVRTGPIQG